MLIDLRHEVKKVETREGSNRLERLAFRIWAWVMCHPRVYEISGMIAAALGHAVRGAANDGWMREAPGSDRIPPLRAWLSQRDMPPPPARSFRHMWRSR